MKVGSYTDNESGRSGLSDAMLGYPAAGESGGGGSSDIGRGGYTCVRASARRVPSLVLGCGDGRVRLADPNAARLSGKP